METAASATANTVELVGVVERKRSGESWRRVAMMEKPWERRAAVALREMVVVEGGGGGGGEEEIANKARTRAIEK